MKSVWKYKISVEDYTVLNLPVGAKPLSVQEQRGEVYLWCLVNPDQKVHETRTFRLAGTGHPIVENVEFLGTFQLYEGSFVGHLFEVK